MTAIEYMVVCIDNSDYMRNEDVQPNRFMAQKDSVNIIAHHILSLRSENQVGMVTLADSPQVVQSLTTNEINLLRKLYAIEMKGDIDFAKGIKVSLLALKQISLNGLITKNMRQRIVVFVGSPITDQQIHFDDLVTILNKMKISVDIIVFGSENQNKIEILNTFVNKLKDSHLIVVPNDRIMANVVQESNILAKSRDFRLINENVDPELALAMKLSVEDQKKQNQTNAGVQQEKQPKNQKSKSNTCAPTGEDDLLRAIAMSLNQNGYKKESAKSKSSQSPMKSSKTDSKRMSEEEQLALTLQMSLLNSNKKSVKKNEPTIADQKTEQTKEKTKEKTPKNNSKMNDKNKK